MLATDEETWLDLDGTDQVASANRLAQSHPPSDPLPRKPLAPAGASPEPPRQERASHPSLASLERVSRDELRDDCGLHYLPATAYK